MSLEKENRKYVVIGALWPLILAPFILADAEFVQEFLFFGVAPVAALLGWRWIKAAKE